MGKRVPKGKFLSKKRTTGLESDLCWHRDGLLYTEIDPLGNGQTSSAGESPRRKDRRGNAHLAKIRLFFLEFLSH